MPLHRQSKTQLHEGITSVPMTDGIAYLQSLIDMTNWRRNLHVAYTKKEI